MKTYMYIKTRKHVETRRDIYAFIGAYDAFLE